MSARRTKEEIRRARYAEIDALLERAVGKTVQAISQEVQHHMFDGEDKDGAITIEFTDGTHLVIEGGWCNDNTAATEAWWEDE